MVNFSRQDIIIINNNRMGNVYKRDEFINNIEQSEKRRDLENKKSEYDWKEYLKKKNG